jgi:hypothetical protein
MIEGARANAVSLADGEIRETRSASGETTGKDAHAHPVEK